MFEAFYKMNEKKVCIVIPVYNNVKTVGSVIDDAKEYLSDIVVIDDGSNDGTSDIIKSKNVLSHKFEHNQGKGSAIKKGLKIAEEKGFDYVITIDADGQHFPQDITKFITNLNGNNNILAIGKRDFKENVTGRSKFGRVWSNFWCNFLTLEKIEDAQSVLECTQ
jgi:glycosyltransferase involved in cell wall biosynthesis